MFRQSKKGGGYLHTKDSRVAYIEIVIKLKFWDILRLDYVLHLPRGTITNSISTENIPSLSPTKTI